MSRQTVIIARGLEAPFNRALNGERNVQELISNAMPDEAIEAFQVRVDGVQYPDLEDVAVQAGQLIHIASREVAEKGTPGA